jgi:anti-sigma regulatory factor (Ser/Thr protein kinase)
VTTRLAGNGRAPASARSYVAHQLTAGGLPERVPIDDVVLIASELVTNAVRVGADWIDVTVRVTRGRLDLVVGDDAGGWPVLGTADGEAIGGRGLGIVDQLADSWKVTRRAKGKLVTASWVLHRAARSPR